VREFPSNNDIKDGYPQKHYLAAIGSSSVKTAAEKYRHVAYVTCTNHGLFLLSFINIDDLE